MAQRRHIRKWPMARMLERVATQQIKRRPARDQAVALMVIINWYNTRYFTPNRVNMRWVLLIFFSYFHKEIYAHTRFLPSFIIMFDHVCKSGFVKNKNIITTFDLTLTTVTECEREREGNEGNEMAIIKNWMSAAIYTLIERLYWR